MTNKRDFVEVRTKELAVGIEGKSEVFGSADLVFKSILELIDCLDFKFIKEHQDYDLTKYYIQIIDRLGSKMIDEDYEDFPGRNAEVVKWFIEEFFKNNMDLSDEYSNLIDKHDDEYGVMVSTGKRK